MCEGEGEGLYHNSVHPTPKCEVEIGDRVGVEMAILDSKIEAATNHVLLAQEKENQCGPASYTTGVVMCVRNCVRPAAKRETKWEEQRQNVRVVARIRTSLVTPSPLSPSLQPNNRETNISSSNETILWKPYTLCCPYLIQ